METEIILTTSYQLDKPQVIKVGTVINSVFNKKVIGGKGRKICSTSSDGDGFHYTYTFGDENTEDHCDLLANELYNKLDFEFELQVECDIDEEYLEPCDDSECYMLIDDDETVKHSNWVSSCIDEGWSLGSEYNSKDKTSPFLKSYHSLTETQKKVLIKSKDKHGKLCVDEDIMAECYRGVK